MRHLENMNKIILATGCMVGYAYAIEFFIAWYSGNPYERFAFLNRALRPVRVGVLDRWSPATCSCRSCSGSRRCARTSWMMFVVAICVNVGMWFERFVIIVTSLQPRLPAVELGHTSCPTWVDLLHARRQLRPVLHAVPAVLPLPADGGDGRGEDRHAGGDPRAGRAPAGGRLPRRHSRRAREIAPEPGRRRTAQRGRESAEGIVP